MLKLIIGFIAFLVIYWAIDNFAALIPEWIGYLVLSAVAILPFAWIVKRVLWDA